MGPLSGVLVVLLGDAIVNARVLLWDGTGGTSSSDAMGCRFCGFEFDRGRSLLDTSRPGSERCPEFARLRWDEREAAFATGGARATGDRGPCDISCLVVAVARGASCLLGQHPIVRREDEATIPNGGSNEQDLNCFIWSKQL